MSKQYWNKLVRDGIKKKLTESGAEFSLKQLTNDAEFKSALLKKVQEEATELAASTSRLDFLREYADLMLVLDALTLLMEFSEADIKIALAENVALKGWFKDRDYLEWTEEPTSL